MTKTEEQKRLRTLGMIRERAQALRTKTVTLGFDGFIDSVVRVVKQKDPNGTAHYFESTQAFGEYIVEKGQKSFSIELEELTTKLGGNMPIMANAIAKMGPNVSCIGPLGYPEIHPVFRQMQNCHLYSFGSPGLTKILEFNTGKIMLAEMTGLSDIPWEFIRDTVGISKFRELFEKSELIALLNWSELDNSTAIWKGLLKDVLEDSHPAKKPVGFFDLSDCSKRDASYIREAMKLLTGFAQYWDVVLSLNLNEATIVHDVLSGGNQNNGDIKKMCDHIFDKLNIHTVIIHSARQSLARDKDGIFTQSSFFIKVPAISSGAGDNFNAGFAAGRLMGLPTGTSLALGNATSALYMQSANSPSVDDVINFLSGNLSTWSAPDEAV